MRRGGALGRRLRGWKIEKWEEDKKKELEGVREKACTESVVDSNLSAARKKQSPPGWNAQRFPRRHTISPSALATALGPSRARRQREEDCVPSRDSLENERGLITERHEAMV